MTEQPNEPNGIPDIHEVDDPRLIAKLCADCVPKVHRSKWATIDAGGVYVWATAHDPSCPWLRSQPLEDGRYIINAPEQRLVFLHEFADHGQGHADVSTD